MITEKDVQEAIAYCEGKLDPKRDDALLLAACYTIRREIFEKSEQSTIGRENFALNSANYSYAVPPVSTETLPRYSGAEPVGNYGDSDFLHAVQGKDPSAMWTVMDELMETLKMVNPRVYDGVMRKIR